MNIVIIGNGITGITAARHIRNRSNHKITVISSESEYFFLRTALIYVCMGHEKFENIKPYEDRFREKNKIDLIQDYVTSIDTAGKKVIVAGGNSLFYDKLIIATGSKSTKPGWDDLDLNGVQRLYSLQDLDLPETNTRNIKNAVIIGGGLIVIELAEMLKSRGISVTMIVRENSCWNNVLTDEESMMVNRHFLIHDVNLKLSSEVTEIRGDVSNNVKSVITKSGEEIPCDFAGINIGVTPNVDAVRNTEIEINRGILVNEFLETNIKDIYAAGDSGEFRKEFPY